MLWFDDGPQGLKDKVARAVSFYATKYGRSPTVCLVHPATRAGAEMPSVDGVLLRETRSILPNHFLVGIEDRPALQAEPRRARKTRPAARSESGRQTAARRKAA
jgi:hypothetical protein